MIFRGDAQAAFVPRDVGKGPIPRVVETRRARGALPTWPYSSAWGYYPSGGLGLVVLILIILVLAGRI